MNNEIKIRSPRLLVSVRNLSEAKEAIAGGCDWLDLKEPNNGALGKSDDLVIAEVAQYFQQKQIDIPLSTALGEFADFDTQKEQHFSDSIRFAKFGLSHLVGSQWIETLSRYFERETTTKPVAVFYADSQRADSPRLDDVIKFASQSRAPYVLIDTFIKDSTSLFDWMDESAIRTVAEFCRDNNVGLALAGRISQSDFDQLKTIPFDILAVRSAVCENGDRKNAVCRNKVAEFRANMRDKLSLRFGRDVAITPAG